MKKTALSLADLHPGQFSVVRIIARLNVGGPAQHVVHLTRELADSHPTLLIAGAPETDEIEVAEAGEHIALLRLHELGRRVRPWQDLVALVKVYRILRAVGPTIVHTHTAKAGTIGRLAAFAAGIPVRIHTFHGHVFEGYFSKVVSRLVVGFERLLARLSSCIVAISERQALDLTERYRICARDRLRVVPLGLDLERFGQSGDGGGFRREIGANGAYLVVTVGRLVPVKNHRMLLAAAAQLKDLNIRFAIVGGGAEEASLRAYAKELGIADRVVFTGWRFDLPSVYASCDLAVLTSLNEGTPVCLIEAMAAGVPVIASDVGGVSDVLKHGQLGVLVPSGDARQLAEAIRRRAAQPRDEKELAEIREYVLQRYAVQRLVQDVRRLYWDLQEDAGQTAAQELPRPSYQT